MPTATRSPRKRFHHVGLARDGRRSRTRHFVDVDAGLGDTDPNRTPTHRVAALRAGQLPDRPGVQGLPARRLGGRRHRALDRGKEITIAPFEVGDPAFARVAFVWEEGIISEYMAFKPGAVWFDREGRRPHRGRSRAQGIRVEGRGCTARSLVPRITAYCDDHRGRDRARWPTASPRPPTRITATASRRRSTGIAGAGFTSVELTSVPGWTEHVRRDADDAEIQRVKDLLRQHGLTAVSLSGHSDLVSDEGVGEFRKALNLARKLGIEQGHDLDRRPRRHLRRQPGRSARSLPGAHRSPRGRGGTRRHRPSAWRRTAACWRPASCPRR